MNPFQFQPLLTLLRRYQKYALYAVAVAVLSLQAKPVMAGSDPAIIKVLDGSQGQLRIDSTNTIEDAKYSDPLYSGKLVKPYQINNSISLTINELSLYTIQSDFTVHVILKVTKWDEHGFVDSSDLDLTVQYKNGTSYSANNIFAFSNAYKVQIRVEDTTSDANWNVWNVLKVSNKLQSFPAYTFECSADAIKTVAKTDLPSNTSSDELRVSWGNVINADQYDLEWTYVDSAAFLEHRYGADTASPSASLIFDDNCSRVTITQTAYAIPLMYDGSGVLFFRVRPVQLQPGGGRSEAHWSSDYISDGGLGRFYFAGHQRNLNWQSSVSFAEEGKRKVVVQYYDGSLRSRQTVTKDNTLDTTIVAETFYDFQGRPAVQVLPSPTLSSVIGYYKNFNVDLNGNAYDKTIFDTFPDPSYFCNSPAPAMSTNSGASRYYSPQNNAVSYAYNKYIPDAKGYPFTETEYTQDNTGRISRQGGVGPMHRLGGGHETQYFYGTPDQRQLDALFGTEVGDHSHYYKTMVRDANGQYSVSYTDMHGRTIATALAGTPPDSIKLDKLSSNTSSSITESLTDSNSVVIKDLVMESKKGLLVPVAGLDTFTYTLSPQTLSLKDCSNNTICYDCLYDLEISMTDDCNNQKLGGQAFDTVFHNFSLGSIDTLCNGSGFSVTFTKYLQEGSYEITKKLSVSRQGNDYYRDSIFMAKNVCVSKADVIHKQALLIAAAEALCHPDCQSCMDSLGTFSSFYSKFMARAGVLDKDTASYLGAAFQAYQQAQTDCDLLCNKLSDYNDIRQQMLLDMTPQSGQYALLDNIADKYSIFHEDLEASPPDTPQIYQRMTGYLDETGKPDQVFDEKTGTFVSPQDLGDSSFAQKFKLSWAETLLPHHPEYCKLQQYEKLQTSDAWDRRFEGVDTYAGAMAKGYLNPTGKNSAPFSTWNATGPSGTADPDPLASFGEHDYKTPLEALLQNYTQSNPLYSGSLETGVSMWAWATAQSRCAGKDSSCFLSYATNTTAFSTDLCAADLDMAWRTFRQMYLDTKRRLINTQITADCSSSPTAAQLMAAGHQPHFSDALELLTATNAQLPSTTAEAYGYLASQKDSLNASYGNNCRAYATAWFQQLSNCTVYSENAINNDIIPKLIQVCEAGSDPTHPYGSSSVAPGSTYTYKSFEDVIEKYNTAHGISSAANCNAYGILAPKPYGQQLIYSSKPVYSQPDGCECTQISMMFNRYQAAAFGYTSFSNYLSVVYNTQISDAELDTLLSRCSLPASACVNLAIPIMLPPVLQCGAGDVCLPCVAIVDLNNEFSSKYPGKSPAENTSGTDSTQIGINQLYEQFMNYRTGFSKNTWDYLDFMAQCHGSTPAGNDSLQKIMTDFKNKNFTDTTLIDRAHFHLSAVGDDNTPILTSIYSDIFANGVAHVPQSLVASTPYANTNLAIEKDDTMCVNNAFTVETRVKQDPSSFAGRPCSGVNFVFWDTYGPALAFSVNLSADSSSYSSCGYGLYTCQSGCSFDTTDRQKFVRNLFDWVTIKAVLKDNVIKVYVNDTLIRTASYSIPINKITRFSWGINFGYIDYVKVYDSTGHLQYVEDFNDVKQSPSNYPAAFACTDCRTSFTSFFNQKRHSSLTYDQIDSIYLKDLGYHASFACNDTLATVDSIFNNSYNDYGRAYDQNGCDSSTWVLDYGGAVNNTPAAHKDAFHDGIMQFPLVLNENGVPDFVSYDFVRHDSACVDGHFSLEFRLKDSLPPGVGTYMDWEIWVNTNPITSGPYRKQYYLTFDATHPAGSAIEYSDLEFPENNQTIFSTSLAQNFTHWRILKLTFINNLVYFYLDSVLINTYTFPVGVNPQKFYGVSLTSGTAGHLHQKSAMFDWIKGYDKNDSVFYDEEFNDCSHFSMFSPYIECPKVDCKDYFTNTYNTYTGKHYSFLQIDSIYIAQTGQHPNVCGLPQRVEEDSCSKFTFIKDFAGAGIDSLMDIQQTRDGGYIAAGHTTSFGKGNFDAYLMKTDRKGNLLWSKTYGGTAKDEFRRVKQTFDGGYIAVGFTNSYHQSQGEIFITKTDANGAVEWARGFAKGTTNGEIGIDVIQNSDSGYTVLGLHNYAPAVSDWEIIRLSNSGAVLWGKQLGTASSDNLGSMLEDSGKIVFGGLSISSELGDGNTYYDAVLAKLNISDGGVVSTDAYDVQGRSNWNLSISKSSNGYRANVLGSDNYTTANGQNIVLDLNRDGSVNSARALPLPPGGSVTWGTGATTADGGYIFAQGQVNAGADIVVHKLHPGGFIAWTNIIRRPGNQFLQTIIQNADGSYTGVGEDGTHALMIKFDTLGRTLCSDSLINAFSSSATYTHYADANLEVDNSLSFSNTVISVTAMNAAMVQTSVCSTDSCAVSSSIVNGPTLCGHSDPVFPPVLLDAVSNCMDSVFFAVSKGTEIYAGLRDSLMGNFDSAYRAKCLNAYKYESFTVKHTNNEYHYTLYYYDQAGNLLKTVSPAGVRANYSSGWLDSVAIAKSLNQTKVPSHILATQYRYNTLNQVTAQLSPDAGLSTFWYDRLGRLSLSQSARQLAKSGTETGRQYSYTLYDYLGRISEVGQINNGGSTPMADSISIRPSLLEDWLDASAAGKEQITQTLYDVPYAGLTGYSPTKIVQRNLRNRVSYTSVTTGYNPANYDNATFFTYDIHGNVDTLLQDYGSSSFTESQNVMNMNGNRFKRIVYQYDLISGKVNMVAYQPATTDQYFHHYDYDAENRITDVETSEDSVYWVKRAHYEYYKHGPLARMVLGNDEVQGVDYAYTLQGWLKGVNSMSLRTGIDMGGDGEPTGLNKYITNDAYGFQLNYYTGDYTPINSAVDPFPGTSAALSTAYQPLYNGNISSMGVNIGDFYAEDSSSTWKLPLLYNYTYDQLNRLTKMDAFYGLNQNTNSWSSLSTTRDYKERIAYDPNGNITKYLRNSNNNAGTEHAMDSLNYFYNTATNQLNHIKDNAEDWIGGGHDLQDQSSNNYGYDPSGNMTRDLSQAIPDGGISWNAYGKILKVYHSTTTDNNPVKQVTYGYDAGGNRISKRVVKTGTKTVNWTWYVRDASGNLMGTYVSNGDSTHALTDYDLSKQDQVIYGSSRIGVAGTAYGVKKDSYDEFYYSPWNGVHLWVYKGGDQYELTNHLGNVLVTVGDRKIGVPSAANSSLIDHWKADISSAADYYPFGMVMVDRTYQNNYRYGFNGQEKADEVAGNWNHNTAEFWEYDTRSGRRWNLDPKPTFGISPYSSFNNNPIFNSDPLGDTSIQTPGGGMMDIGDKKFETFSGGTQKIGSKIIQPAKGTLKSFTVTGEDIDSKSARFVAMFDKESGEFTGYAWDKQPSHTYEDFINDERAGAADQYAHANDPTYQYYNSPEDARKVLINNSLGVTLPSPIFKSASVAANASTRLRRAFWSGEGTEAKALEQGFGTLGKTRAGQNLIKLTANMPYYPGSQAFKMWGRLSAKYAEGASGVVHVFQNAEKGVQMQSIWKLYEYPALKANANVTDIIFHY